MFEVVRRGTPIPLDSNVGYSTLIYDSKGRDFLAQVYKSYWDVAKDCKLPMLTYTPTWRASRPRLEASNLIDHNVNADCVQFLQDLKMSYQNIFIGGMMGPLGDCYNPREALSENEAVRIHAYQANQLAKCDIDFFFASALPALSEAIGIATTMAVHQIPYVLSFILRAEGTILDGTPLTQVIDQIDSQVHPKPAFYMINCVHPDHFETGMETNETRSKELTSRVKGFQANTSRKTHDELERLTELETEEPAIFAEQMLRVQKRFQLQFVGGCCGTDSRHIRSLGEKLSQELSASQ